MKTKTMSETKFFRLLKERAKTYGFKLDASGWLREKRTECCPVVAVARYLRFKTEHVYAHFSAAGKMGLDEDVARIVARAADNSFLHDPKVRVRLMKAVGFDQKTIKENL